MGDICTRGGIGDPEAPPKTDVTRKQLKEMLGGRRFSLHRVDFTDLARGYCYSLLVPGIPLDTCTAEELKNPEIVKVREAAKSIRRKHTFCGGHII